MNPTSSAMNKESNPIEKLGPPPSPETVAAMKRFPKVDLHCHLEGALHPESVLELATKHGIDLPAHSVEELRPLIQVTPRDETLLDFIRKFETLALLFKNKKIIAELTYAVIQAAQADGVRYLELRFAPTYMATRHGLPFPEIIEGVLEGNEKASKDFPKIKVAYIIILNREAPVPMAKKMVELALRYRHHGVVAVDLAGDEQNYPPELFEEAFQEARRHGLFVTLHAGEARGPESVEIAVRRCKAQRIGHGVRIAGHEGVEQLVKEERVYLEVCPTSNVQTGAVKHWKEHPIRRFLEKSIPVTINTDDPGVSGITLSHEYARLHELYELPIETLKQLAFAGIEAAFLPPNEKIKLRERFQNDLEKL